MSGKDVFPLYLAPSPLADPIQSLHYYKRSKAGPRSCALHRPSNSISDERQRETTLMIALSASKSDGFRVYRGRLLAAAVEAMSKSASRERLDCPAARAAANIRPY